MDTIRRDQTRPASFPVHLGGQPAVQREARDKEGRKKKRYLRETELIESHEEKPPAPEDTEEATQTMIQSFAEELEQGSKEKEEKERPVIASINPKNIRQLDQEAVQISKRTREGDLPQLPFKNGSEV